MVSGVCMWRNSKDREIEMPAKNWLDFTKWDHTLSYPANRLHPWAAIG